MANYPISSCVSLANGAWPTASRRSTLLNCRCDSGCPAMNQREGSWSDRQHPVVGGRMAQPGSGYYSATKFAVEGLSDALRK
jgi:hypothetical protein